MRIFDRSFLGSVFAVGLGACGGGKAAHPPGPSTPSVAPVNPLVQQPHALRWAGLPPEAKAEVARDASEFHATDVRAPGALPFELVAIVDQVSVPSTGKYAAHRTVCDPDPCPAEVAPLEKSIFDRAIVARTRAGIVVVRGEELRPLLGDIDSPAKAALVAAAATRDKVVPARCSGLYRIEAACAEGEADGIAVRVTPEGYEVLVHGERNVCGHEQHGNGEAFLVVKVTAKGEVTFDRERAIARWTAAAAMPDAHCRPVSRGRMHEAYVAAPDARTVLEYFAVAHREERAAAIAFERLAGELASHGAPAALVDAARRGVAEERRHAQLFAELAPQGPAAEAPAFRRRTLLELLLENVREGCANETYAAIVATHQADHAPGELRGVFREIAEDERAHAALAFAIHAWGRTRLDEPQAAVLDAAHAHARAELHAVRGSDLGIAFGEPPPVLALAAFDRVAGELARELGCATPAIG